MACRANFAVRRSRCCTPPDVMNSSHLIVVRGGEGGEGGCGGGVVRRGTCGACVEHVKVRVSCVCGGHAKWSRFWRSARGWRLVGPAPSTHRKCRAEASPS